MYNWNTNAFVQKNFATFFQDSTHFLFDPRVIWDQYWNRFVVPVDACNPCSGTGTFSRLYLAVSQTGDPSGAWWTFSVGAATNFADFPQLGMDLHSIIVTFNDVSGSTVTGRTFAVSKAYLYNGFGWSATLFGGSNCTVAPPYVLDNNATAFVLAFCSNDTKISIGALTNTGLSGANLHWDNSVAVSHHGIPPQAAQPGTNYPLDTGDNRFENRSLQVSDRILNTATINLDGLFPAPAWYDIYTGPVIHTLEGEGVYYASNSSYDWHPAITANTNGGNPFGEIFTTWMSTDPNNNINVQLRAGGGFGASPASGVTGIPVFTSAVPLTNQTDSLGRHRTGDYAYIALYPAPALGCTLANQIGILEGETAGPSEGALWGTHIGIVKH
jgi:hypothetical protein